MDDVWRLGHCVSVSRGRVMSGPCYNPFITHHHHHRPSGTQTSVLGAAPTTFLGVRDVMSLSPVHHILFPVNTNRILRVGTEQVNKPYKS